MDRLRRHGEWRFEFGRLVKQSVNNSLGERGVVARARSSYLISCEVLAERPTYTHYTLGCTMAYMSLMSDWRRVHAYTAITIPVNQA
jgi:hypothetical protein